MEGLPNLVQSFIKENMSIKTNPNHTRASFLYATDEKVGYHRINKEPASLSRKQALRILSVMRLALCFLSFQTA